MEKHNVIFDKLGIKMPDTLLPGKTLNMTQWSVVACDQYTSQPEYWEAVENFIDNSPSSLRLIYPETYLDKPDMDNRIKKINSDMEEYVKKSILIDQGPGFIYIDRSTSHVPSRKGLLVCLDLEKYNYSPGSKTLIRATEGTVIERLPPRVKIRENALLELPHIMVLIDDPEKSVIEPLADYTSGIEPLYDFELMMQSGHIRGWHINNSGILDKIALGLETLANPELYCNKYHVEQGSEMLLFAVGDGNHSLASAKAHWEKIKNSLSPEKYNHPARYALVEIVNIHNEGIIFEPIHRILLNTNPLELLEAFMDYYKDFGPNYEFIENQNEIDEKIKSLRTHGIHAFSFITGGRKGIMAVHKPSLNLETGTLQTFLDYYIKSHREILIDYIHGKDVLENLGAKEGNMGFILPVISKTSFFETVIKEGILPRKSFSMGEADEKRFYLESRYIR